MRTTPGPAFELGGAGWSGVGGEVVDAGGDAVPDKRVEGGEVLAGPPFQDDIEMACGHSPSSALTCSHRTGCAPASRSAWAASRAARSLASSAASISLAMTARTAARGRSLASWTAK